jgi:hypothetical protein
VQLVIVEALSPEHLFCDQVLAAESKLGRSKHVARDADVLSVQLPQLGLAPIGI